MLKAILLRDPMYFSRMAIGGGSILWALHLLLVEDAFTAQGEVTFQYLELLAPQKVWGLLFLVQGVWTLGGVLWHQSCKYTVLMDGALGCVLWTLTTLCMYTAHWPSGMSPLEALSLYQPPVTLSGNVVVAVLAWWHMVRLWAEEDNTK